VIAPSSDEVGRVKASVLSGRAVPIKYIKGTHVKMSNKIHVKIGKLTG